MAWIPQSDRSHFLYESSASQYYWDSPPNPGASNPDLVLANCTTLCYGRAIENGYPAPVTSFRNANRWHNYVNTADGWELLDYESGMQLYAGDIVEWSGNTHLDSEGDYVEDNHVATIEEDGTNPYQSSSWWTYRNTSLSYQAISDYFQSSSYLRYRFYHYTRLSTESVESSGGNKPRYVLRYNAEPQPERPRLTVTPSSIQTEIGRGEQSTTFSFNLTMEYIPEDETISGGISYPGLDLVSETNWNYETYTEGDFTYQRATKSITLRYYRESKTSYTTTKTVSFNYSMSTGSVNTSRTVTITVENAGAVLFLQYDGGAYEIR